MLTLQLNREIYNRNKDIVMAEAYKACRHYGIAFEDCLSHAHEIFCDAVTSFDDSFGASFRTHLNRQMLKMSRLYNTKSKEFQMRERCVSMSDHISSNSDGDSLTREDMIGREDVELSAKDIWNWLSSTLDSDANELAFQIIFGDLSASRVSAKSAHRIWAKEQGWEFSRTVKAFNSIHDSMLAFRNVK